LLLIIEEFAPSIVQKLPGHYIIQKTWRWTAKAQTVSDRECRFLFIFKTDFQLPVTAL